MMDPKISLYIPTYNAASMLSAVLTGVEQLEFKPDEILIIDDGSTDGSGDIAKEFDVTVIRKDKNQGLAAARNTALKLARNDLIACIDSDVLVETDWLSELVKYMQENLDISAVGGRLDEKYSDGLADAWRTKHMPQNWGEKDVYDPPFLFGANSLYRKKALIDIGGFNPLFHTNGEDSNICRRLKEAGHKIAYTPNARCWHLKKDTISSLLRAYWKWMRHPICVEWPIDNWKSLYRFSQRRFSHHLKSNFWPDLKAGRISLLWIDILILFYSPTMEFKEFLKQRKKGSA